MPTDIKVSPPGVRRVNFMTTETELVAVGQAFALLFSSLLESGLDLKLVWSAMAFELGVAAQIAGVVVHLDEPVKVALPAIEMGIRCAARTRGH